MTMTDSPRGQPEEGYEEFKNPEIQALMERSERRYRENQARKPRTPEQVAKERLGARLRYSAMEIKRLANDVAMRLQDCTGNFRWAWISPPVDNSDLRGISPSFPRLLDRWERIKREAAEGCVESEAFVEKWEPILMLALHLRHERPPERAPGYDPYQWLETLTVEQRAFLAR